ncbi:MAG: SIMPL domain-containing protein [Campylobacteraceae bacterium]|nr:SIMPL domain-containing protein [Campylobacteraceae bacterium]
MQRSSAFILGFFLLLGATALGMSISNGLLAFKTMERTVTVKGLAEREVPADIVIWPVQYTRTGDDLSALYREIEDDKKRVLNFLELKGFKINEISVNAPIAYDKLSNQYGSSEGGYRYILNQTLSIYSTKVDEARSAMVEIEELGKEGITFKGDAYENLVEYLYSNLNELKPDMLKEATLNARAAAQTFADDSESKLGKIKTASQGQFSINERDKNTPHIKTVRIVSTIVYYLND